MRDEIAARADASGGHFGVDNAKAFDILKNAVLEFKSVYAWIKEHTLGKNCRAAFTALKDHYLGDSQLDTIANLADDKLDESSYDGEQKGSY